MDKKLIDAARKGNLKTVKHLLQQFTGYPRFAFTYYRAIETALKNGHLEIMRIIQQDGVVKIPRFNINVIKHAISNKNIEMLRILINEGLYIPNKHDDIDIFAFAIDKGDIEMFKMLLDANDKPDYNNLIIEAASHRKEEIVRLLFDKGADIHTKRMIEIFDGLVYGGFVNIVSTLLDIGVDFDEWALRQSTQYGNITMTRMLLDAGTDINENKIVEFRNRVRNGEQEIVNMLTEYGADLTVLHKKAYDKTIEDYTYVGKMLDNYQPDDPDLIVDKLGTTNLMIVAQNGPTYKLREYLTRTQNVNQRDNQGNTALLYAIGSNDHMRTKLILDRGANPLIRNKKGHTPWDYAKAMNNPKIVMLLLPTASMIAYGVPLDIRQMINLYR